MKAAASVLSRFSVLPAVQRAVSLAEGGSRRFSRSPRQLQQQAVLKALSAGPKPLGDGPTVQAFRNNTLVGDDLQRAVLPGGGMYTFTNMKVAQLVQQCLTYRVLENGHLDMAVYMTSKDQIPVFEDAVRSLEALIVTADMALGLMGKDKVYDAVRPLVRTVLECAKEDHVEYLSRFKGASDATADAYNKIFKLKQYANPYAVLPQDFINVDNFLLAHQAGLLERRMIKWWRTEAYPGFNAHIELWVGGAFWAIAHVKWEQGVDTKSTDPKYYNFKTKANESFAAEFSDIQNGSVQVYLLGACFPHLARTNAAWISGEKERFC